MEILNKVLRSSAILATGVLMANKIGLYIFHHSGSLYAGRIEYCTTFPTFRNDFSISVPKTVGIGLKP